MIQRGVFPGKMDAALRLDDLLVQERLLSRIE